MRLLLISSFALLFTLAQGAVEGDGNTPAMVLSYSSDTHQWIKDAPIRTVFFVAMDAAAEDNAELVRAIQDSARVHQDNILHVTISPKEKSPLQRYFGGVDYRPAFFMVNRTTGAYARPHAAFDAKERQDWGATVKDFVRGFLDEQNDARERAEADKNSLVLPLTDDSFDEATKKYPLFVVEFYAPWCPHCKKAAPHMEEAAKQLSEATPPMPLAKVDVTASPKLKKQFQIDSFPQFRAFRKGRLVEGSQIDGEPTSSAIVKFVRRMSKTPVVAATDEALLKVEKQHAKGVVVVAFLADGKVKGKGKGNQNEAADESARALQHAAIFADATAGSDHVFVRATSPESAARHSVARPALLVLNQGRELNVPFEWPDAAHGEGAGADGSSLAQAVEQAVWPLVAKFTRDPLQRRAVMTHPVKDLLLVVLDKDDFAFDSLYDAITASAEANRGRMLHFWIDSRDKFLLKKLRIAESSVPAVLALNPQKKVKPRRMPQEVEISAESLIAFVDDYFGLAGGADKSEL